MEPKWLLQPCGRKPVVPWTRVEAWGRPGSPGPSASHQFSLVHFRAQHSPLQEMFWSCSLFSSDPKRMGGSSRAEGGSG